MPFWLQFKYFGARKGRWVGSKLIDVFRNEFRGESEGTLVKRFAAGHIRINGNAVKEDYVLKNNDFLEGKVHRHELPVKADKLETIFEDESFFVINKPASIPVHPAGRFRYNTIMFILAKEGKQSSGLNVVHRLDRLTSGVQIFAKNSSVAKSASLALKLRQTRKIYVAAVQGDFSSQSEVVCQAPIAVLCHKIGVQSVSQSGGLACVTIFKKVVYDVEKSTSILLCAPVTGRTHQIRVHCQYLGHPIVSDPLYNTEAWGTSKGKGVNDLKDDEKEEIIQKLMKEHSETNGMEWRSKRKFLKKSDPPNSRESDSLSPETASSESSKAINDETEKKDSKSNSASENCSKYFDPICEECGFDYEDPKPSELEICLHAFTYKVMGQKFVAPLPHWAVPFKESIDESILKFEKVVEKNYEEATPSESLGFVL